MTRISQKRAVASDSPTGKDLDDVVVQIEAVKRLLVLLLMKSGSSQGEIARALGVNQATVSRHFGIGEVAPLTVALSGQTESR
jgi:hypothetical protein